ncbi:MAG TPA: choice-of-anchor tandem repeat GloVer-containing protein [Terriglobia bacterium]
MRKLTGWRIIFLVFAFHAVAIRLPALTASTLLSFDLTDGASPRGSLVQGFDGNFYGTTEEGGVYGFGTLFEITPAGKLTALYSFCSQGPPYCTDGAYPIDGLVQATNGNFYGTNEFYGAYGGGTVFEITPKGVLTTLYSFCAQPGCTDGGSPYAGLVQATNGNFYGTTYKRGGLRRWHGLRNHLRGHADHAAQL